jgi:hypothetical protein
MSLLSQRDREIAISALEQNLKTDQTEYPQKEVNTLINWIKLEYYKNK